MYLIYPKQNNIQLGGVILGEGQGSCVFFILDGMVSVPTTLCTSIITIKDTETTSSRIRNNPRGWETAELQKPAKIEQCCALGSGSRGNRKGVAFYSCKSANRPVNLSKQVGVDGLTPHTDIR